VISIVIPLHNEERSIALLYEELQAALEPLEREWEAVFVDDGSVDGSFAALTRLHAMHDNVRVVRLRRNFGKATALATGFDQATGETVVTIDADLQDDPAEIPRLLVKLDEGFDLVSGWKTHRRDPLRRRIPSRIFNWVTGRVSGLRLHDMNCGLKAYRAEVVHGMRLYGELHRFIPVLAQYRGFRVAELPVNHRPREHGRSRYGSRALHPRVPRSADGLVHRPLSASAAAPVRRPRADPRPDWIRDPPFTSPSSRRSATRSATGRCSLLACCWWWSVSSSSRSA